MDSVEATKLPRKPHFLIKTFIAYLYFIQGFYLSLASTVILLYPKYPKPTVLSHFSITYLPFSFKYITAPLVERYTIPRYGRRKFAIVISLIMTTVLTIPLLTNLTNQKQHMEVVVLLFLIFLFVSMGDISLDAASVKQLDDPVMSSYIQMCFQSIGNIFGGLFLIKMAKPNSDWYLFETKSPVCTAQTLILIVGGINLVVGLLLHFFYKERVLEDEAEEDIPSFKKIFKYYLHFLNPRYKMCRFIIYLLVFNQGLKFFTASFQPQAIYRGFDKLIIPQIQTVCIFLALLANTVVSKLLNEHNMWKIIRIVNLIQLLFVGTIFMIGSFRKQVVIGTLVVNSILSLIIFMINMTKINTFGQSSMAAVCITTLASFSNFGNNTWVQLKVYDNLGYEKTVWIGLTIATIIVLCLGKLTSWVDRGQPQQHELWSESSSQVKQE